jgi:hypothetical protein
MAVEDKYVNANIVAGKKAESFATVGQKTITLVQTVEIAAGDDNGSVYRFFAGVPSTYIPTEISIVCDAITNGTDFDLGLYEVNGGAVIDKDVLMDGQTLATALTRATGYQLGLGIVDRANVTKTLGELSAQTNVSASYDIALTGNAVGTVAGTVSIIATFVQG